MTGGRALADGLTSVASRYTPDARKAKLELLDGLETARVGSPAALLRLHETLCFLQAYPDDAEVLARVDRALAAFPARARGLGATARRRLHDAGVARAALSARRGDRVGPVRGGRAARRDALAPRQRGRRGCVQRGRDGLAPMAPRREERPADDGPRAAD